MDHLALLGRKAQADDVELEADGRLQHSPNPPVFLHCGWRTRGTWVWDQFRRVHGVAGYYEPLGETLAWLRPSALASVNAESWPSGHNSLDRPYFGEFRLLLKRNGLGVEGYRTNSPPMPSSPHQTQHYPNWITICNG